MKTDRDLITLEELKTLLHYDPDTGLFTWIVNRRRARIGMIAGTPHSKGYVRVRIYRVNYFAHRLAWFYMTGAWPTDTIDHRDLCFTNNRWNNLRPASLSQNQHNRAVSSNNTTGFKGVSQIKPNGKFYSRIRINSKCIHLGYFPTGEAAHAAYCEAAAKLHKQFARVA